MINPPFDKIVSEVEIATLQAQHSPERGEVHPLVSVALHPGAPQQPRQISVNTCRALQHVLREFPDWARNLKPRLDLLPDFRPIDKLRDWLPILEGAMRKERFTEEQMVAIMREADREPVAVVAKRHGISEQTIYVWRKRFGGLQSNDVRRLKQLEAENARLKKLVAERDLEIEVMKEVAAKNW